MGSSHHCLCFGVTDPLCTSDLLYLLFFDPHGTQFWCSWMITCAMTAFWWYFITLLVMDFLTTVTTDVFVVAAIGPVSILFIYLISTFYYICFRNIYLCPHFWQLKHCRRLGTNSPLKHLDTQFKFFLEVSAYLKWWCISYNHSFFSFDYYSFSLHLHLSLHFPHLKYKTQL